MKGLFLALTLLMSIALAMSVGYSSDAAKIAKTEVLKPDKIIAHCAVNEIKFI